MYRYSAILLVFLLMCSDSTAQIGRYIKVVQKGFNWGARAGFIATNINSYQMYQGETEISGNATNQVGFQCAFFGKTNVGKFFLQPDFSYYLTRESYLLNLPPVMDINTQEEIVRDISLKKNSQSLNAAILLGYNIVKSDVYIFNFFLGPNFIYNYATKYEINELFDNRHPQHKMDFITGVSANISHLYFDFRYEIKIPAKNDIHFSDMGAVPDYLQDISIRESKNLLSFSIGIMF